ncbi:MAG: hypothetical protein M3P27_07280 [Acidobacteriota bacterium]|nr:hypothetical protein [Acidobacteriota bacterium]
MHSYPASRSDRDPRLLALAFFVVVTLLGFVFDRFLVFEGTSRAAALVLTNALTGMIAAALFYQYARNRQAERDAVRDRIQTIADMNHHVRNALQVLSHFGAQQQDREAVTLMRESIERIEWTLREVLPRYGGIEPEPGSTPASNSRLHLQ